MIQVCRLPQIWRESGIGSEERRAFAVGKLRRLRSCLVLELVPSEGHIPCCAHHLAANACESLEN